MASPLFFVIFTFASIWKLSGNSSVAASHVPPIFAFGDSLADIGNNNYLNTSTDMKANFPLNGIDFPNRTSTGRFSNGYNTIDFLAKFVGHEQSPPPFLSITQATQMHHGVNFASGGSGILDTTGTTIAFKTQIEHFRIVVDILVKQMGEERAAHMLSKSLFVISTGSNDLFGYYLTLGAQNATQNEQFVAILVHKFTDCLKALHELGARKFAVLGISHIGCIPAMRVLSEIGSCVDDLNHLAKSFNRLTKARMHLLKSQSPGMRYSYGNIYPLVTLSLTQPQIFGYKETKGACCGSGKFNGASLCTTNATLCSNRDQFIFWDRFHPTEVASKYTAKAMYDGLPKFATPINVKMLATY